MRVRSLEELRAAGALRWFQPVLHRLAAPAVGTEGFLVPGAPLLAARAPGRLDVMGGIADYSGGTVLELPLEEAAYAILQRQSEPRLDLISVREGVPHRFSLELAALVPGGPLDSNEALRRWFGDAGDVRWAGYVVGGLRHCLERAPDAARRGGFRLLVDSRVPEGKGVSSSAALEVATLAVLASACGLQPGAEEMARECQRVEIAVVGAPCGVMDQMTSARGRQDRLLRLRCRPAQVEGWLPVPAGFRFHGIDSGVRHSVSGADYGTVRAAAFMGYRIFAERAGLRVESAGEGRVRVEDGRWGGWLAGVPLAELEAGLAAGLPERLRGEAFLQRYGGTTDAATRVEPDREYPVRAAASHPIREEARVERFAELLATLPAAAAAAEALGDLMYEAHASYGACGLGSPATDALVERVRRAGPGLLGAKITGGGSGGTVAVLAREEAGEEVLRIARDHERETGLRSRVFSRSGPGAAEAGLLRLP